MKQLKQFISVFAIRTFLAAHESEYKGESLRLGAYSFFSPIDEIKKKKGL